MSTAKCYSAHLVGLSIEIIEVEVDISIGLNAVSIVGLGDRSVEEAKDRVSAAIKNSGYVSPKQKNQKVVISLAPADVRKEGPAFDLAIAMSYLSAAGEMLFNVEETLFLGELSLDGKVRKVAGVLPILCQAAKKGWGRALVSIENSEECSVVEGMDVFAVSSLAEAIAFMGKRIDLEAFKRGGHAKTSEQKEHLDMNAIRGNEAAKRGLEIAAAGGHNVLMFGPPGTGKTMLAQSFPSLLPPLSQEESIEVTGIYSVARALDKGLMRYPPFRAPHHTASYPAIVGGGAIPKPGEITLAHRGVLFLDEFPEFSREVIEALRQPLEDHEITISRAKGTVTFPAQSILIASMNPCPCGKPRGKGCECKDHVIKAYRRRVSAPIMDRIDIWVNVNKVDYEKLAAKAPTGEPSSVIATRVEKARSKQKARFSRAGLQKFTNSELSAKDIEALCHLTDEARATLSRAAQKLELSGRAFHRMIKVARTIADLAGREATIETDMLEALQYRQNMDL